MKINYKKIKIILYLIYNYNNNYYYNFITFYYHKKIKYNVLVVYIKILELLFWFLFSFKNNKLILLFF